MSRPRSGRSNAAPARAGARPGVFVQTPKSDIFVAMLAIALGAMVVGSLLMVLILNQYEFKLKVAGISPAPAASAIA